MPEIRKGMPDVQLTRQEFDRRLRERFADPAFAPLEGAIGRIADAAWNAYHEYRKAPHTRKAGQGYADPDYDYEDYRPAYQLGYEGPSRYRRSWDESEESVKSEWDQVRGKSRLTWDKARDATRAAWHRVEARLPGDADRDGI